MKINTFIEELRGKSVEELNEELVAAKKELFNLRFQNATNQLDNTSRISLIARVTTCPTCGLPFAVGDRHKTCTQGSPLSPRYSFRRYDALSRIWKLLSPSPQTLSL